MYATDRSSRAASMADIVAEDSDKSDSSACASDSRARSAVLRWRNPSSTFSACWRRSASASATRSECTAPAVSSAVASPAAAPASAPAWSPPEAARAKLLVADAGDLGAAVIFLDETRNHSSSLASAGTGCARGEPYPPPPGRGENGLRAGAPASAPIAEVPARSVSCASGWRACSATSTVRNPSTIFLVCSRRRASAPGFRRRCGACDDTSVSSPPAAPPSPPPESVRAKVLLTGAGGFEPAPCSLDETRNHSYSSGSAENGLPWPPPPGRAENGLRGGVPASPVGTDTEAEREAATPAAAAASFRSRAACNFPLLCGVAPAPAAAAAVNSASASASPSVAKVMRRLRVAVGVRRRGIPMGFSVPDAPSPPRPGDV
mmetsp:Transcript_6302/g.15685  ORF Transcript_6302/g.15685 Transcript_6302/m.15685 type:complete len:377 (+) Transcript_6302:86-1216(+)